MTHVSATLAAIDCWCEILVNQGYCIIPDALPPATIAALDRDLSTDFEDTPFCQGPFYGETTKRFGRLLSRSRLAASLVQHDVVQGIADRILLSWCDNIQLNVAQAIAVHPGAPAQLPHRDADMWRLPPGGGESLVNVIWPLSEFTADNGATRLWPRSHGAFGLGDEESNHAIAAEMIPGSALVFLGSTLHCAGANRTMDVRRAAVIGYSLGWLKPHENPWLAYPPDVARTFSPELAALIGYRQHRPNLGNFEGQCPSVLLDNSRPRRLAAIDALRPDQAEAVEAHFRSQRVAP